MKSLIFSFIVFVNFTVYAQKDNLSTAHFNLSKKNVAVNGYDPVSYFDNQPLKGKSSINFKVEGVLYYFNNESNKNRFIKSSSKFIPQYGGWCAFAMGKKGEMMEVDPKTFKIENGKLYLFYDSFFSNPLEEWNNDEVVLMKQADNNWNKIIMGLK